MIFSIVFYRIFLVFFPGFYWVLLGFTGFYWVLLGFTEFYWVLFRVLPSLTVSTGFHEVFLGNLLDITGFYMILLELPSYNKFYWVLLCLTDPNCDFMGDYWVLLIFYCI